MPSSSKVKKMLLEHLPEIKGGVIMELGAGFGHLALPLAKQNPHLNIEAYELSWVPYLVLKFFKFLYRLPNLKVVRKDFFEISFQEADGFICYLYPKAMERLEKKFTQEMKRGAFILSNTFQLPSWKADVELVTSDLFLSRIFLYKRT